MSAHKCPLISNLKINGDTIPPDMLFFIEALA